MKKRVFIVAGGPSLTDFDFSSLANEDTIVVNSSIFFVPRPKYFITMDYTWFLKNSICFGGDGGKRQSIYDASTAEKFFVVSFSGDRRELSEHGVIDRKFNLEYDLRVVDRILFASRQGGIGTAFSDFRCGEDSGYSALQLAVLLGYEQIYLLGMDFSVLQTEPKIRTIAGSTLQLSSGSSVEAAPIQKIDLSKQTHFFKKMDKSGTCEFTEKLHKYLRFYAEVFIEIGEKTKSKVFSCSSISKLNDFIDYLPIEKVMENI